VRSDPSASTELMLYEEEPGKARRAGKDERIQGPYHV
jgi:hypothetical protein